MTSAMHRDDVIARVGKLALVSDPPGAEEFARQYFAPVDDEDLNGRSVDDLAESALSHWRFGADRARGEALVRVCAPEHGHSVVDIITDDMPFIVDSTMMAISRHGLGVHLVVHPILRVRRTAAGALQGIAPEQPGDDAALESWTHFEIDRETTPSVLDALRADIERVLRDVRAATADWQPMLTQMRAVCAELDASPPPVDPVELAEGRELLRWLTDDHFTFLAYRAYDLRADGTLCPVPKSGLGLLRGAAETPSTSFSLLPESIRAKARERTLLVLTKANARSTVHRPTYLDYVGVKRFDAEGNVIGEHRFLGLYTSSAYTVTPEDVPVLRRKTEAVIQRAGFLPASHDAKNLAQILATYPRDDLFQMDVDELFQTAMGVLRLQERRQVRLFVHREPYGRFVSCLVFLPRDRYTTAVREHLASLLCEAFGAVSYEWNTRLSESVLARLHFVLHVDPATPREPSLDALEQMVAAAARAWQDSLRDACVNARGEEGGLDLFRVWMNAFPGAYQDDFSGAQAVADIVHMEALDDNRPLAVRLTAEGDHFDLKLYGTGAQPSLSDVLPRLTNMGVVVDDEHPYTVLAAGLGPRWIKWFRLRTPTDLGVTAPALRLFEDAFLAIADDRAEDDGLNRLVLAAGLAWREVALVRAYSRYLRQIGTLFSQSYIEDCLARHAVLARRLVELFVARFDPWIAQNGEASGADDLANEIRAGLDAVTSLDDDRILRSLLHLVLATLRTNWFQTGADEAPSPCVVLKLNPTQIPDLPLPRPMFEIWVYAPRVEGVHLRAGKVARGGLRWSDRREDFRTEVLGLMKAQRVKNAVIVPGGAKGGFVVKRPPSDPAALRNEVEACYRLFVDGLLEVTDNLVTNELGERITVPPDRVVRYDGDDPYLVVAADKGTATFSDIANEIAVARGFWLGDAFASGGKHGYDHKVMGITARGAWESTKRHFRHLDLDPDRDDFTVVGIGDMSGDVFGNGMLLSEHIRLVAAFDHRHVFLDPTPDAATSFAERKRLFELARSSWADYDAALISAGGGVYARTLKSVPITPEVRSSLGLDDAVTALTPAELIRAILQAPVDLLYNGGIGTYVKARTESHAAVGDKANDGVRIDGHELRC
ncbi:MAG TPA: NAD-glutamate dehydrogenase domain-containing protein, partial [Acidimicrobiia bacterium]|nr:NAD-glutamate dehydrogenase domain-containing protein [Acidimicrobiia bacterium]